MTGPGPGSRRRGQTRSSNEYPSDGTRYICTGRGSHEPPAVLDRVLPGRQGVALRCPVCGLTKRIGYQARQRLAAAGITVVDISALPF